MALLYLWFNKLIICIDRFLCLLCVAVFIVCMCVDLFSCHGDATAGDWSAVFMCSWSPVSVCARRCGIGYTLRASERISR